MNLKAYCHNYVICVIHLLKRDLYYGFQTVLDAYSIFIISFYCRGKSPVVFVFSISSHFSWFCCYLCVCLVIWTIHIFGMSASNYNRNWDRNVKRTIWFKFLLSPYSIKYRYFFFSRNKCHKFCLGCFPLREDCAMPIGLPTFGLYIILLTKL